MRTSKEIKKLLSNEVENLLRNNSFLKNCDRKLSVVICICGFGWCQKIGVYISCHQIRYCLGSKNHHPENH